MADDKEHKEDMARTKKVRASIQGLLTKQTKYFHEKGATLSYAALNVILSTIDDYYKRFMVVTEKLWGLATGDDYEEKNVAIKEEEFEEAYMSLKTAIAELMEERRPDVHNSTTIQGVSHSPSSAGNDSGGTSGSVRRKIKLPKPEIPKFSGKYEDWLSWKAEFDDMVMRDETLSNVDRFRILRASLETRPLRIIANMETSAENFEKAIKDLEDRYNITSLIVRAHINNLLYLQGGQATSEGLREIIDVAQSHYRSLTTLGSAQQILDTVLITIVLSKLGEKAQGRWEDQSDNKLASWDTFMKEMETYASTLERINVSTSIGKVKTPEGGKKHFTLTTHVKRCVKCDKEGHTIENCKSFVALAPEDRHALIKSLKLCYMCLKGGHSFDKCRARCSKCRGRHHVLIHFDRRPEIGMSPMNDSHVSQIPSTSGPNSFQKALVAAQIIPDEHVLLASVVVHVLGPDNLYVPCHAVLDPGSTNSYVTESFSKLIQAKRYESDVFISGIGSTTAKSKGQANIEISSRFDHSKSFRINVDILQRITDPYPSCAFEVDQWKIPDAFMLADPNFNIPKPIDLLIGGGLFWKLLTCERVDLSPDLPFLFNTQLGWIVVGANSKFGTRMNPKALCAMNHQSIGNDDLSLNQMVQRFWEIENFPSQQPHRNESELECESFYLDSTVREPDGRYVVRLPFKRNPDELGDSLTIATRRFLNLEKKLSRNPELFQSYSKFIKEYQELGHLEYVKDFNPDTPHYFMPHHCVFKLDSSTTKLRVVFDASCKTSSGLSLNDILHTGPKLQPDLMVTLLRFRLFRHVATADIQKMYRQVYMNLEDANFQLILWRDDPSEELKVLRLRTVTYGTAPGAFLSIRTLLKLAEDEESTFSLGAELLRRNFYVDDAMIGSNSVTELQEGLSQLTSLLKKGCFNLSKFCSNSAEISSRIPIKDQESFLKIDEHDIVKTLGMIWEPKQDTFRFTYKKLENTDTILPTKRNVLSELARLFDPLGLIAPVVTLAKILFQSLWKSSSKLDWDTPLPDEYATEWKEWKEQLDNLRHIDIPRHSFLTSDPKTVEMHAFSDASEKAFGACIYLKAIYDDGSMSVRLLTSKSRVAPTKTQTIARLELCAAKLMTDLVSRMRSEVICDLPSVDIHYWTDSEIVLHWLRAEPSTWNVFVAHRVARIQEVSNSAQWHHIPGDINPADILSRGLRPSEITQNDLWWSGPPFLSDPEFEVVPPFESSTPLENILEYRAKKRVLISVKDSSDITQLMHFSTDFRGMRRSLAYVSRFIERCRNPTSTKTARRSLLTDLDSIYVNSKPPLSEEMSAEIKFIILIQKCTWPQEYALLKKNEPIPKNSSLRALAPFIQDDLIRVGGRLQNSNLPFDAKHQILLPKSHPFTRQLCEYYHRIKMCHAGPQTVLNAIRKRYWPIGGMQMVRSVTVKCIWCFRLHPRLMSQIMGPLPSDRINPKDFKAFTVSGVDYAGPFRVRHHARCRQPKDVYLAIFVCFISKALHIEIVPDLTTKSFLNALKRFIADRGTVKKMFSDNATNFRGAARELKSQSDNEIDWEFIPPRTPHAGGLWESSVKSVKSLMRKVIGKDELTFDEFQTVAKHAASIVNSRPITPLSADPNDLQPLTPAQFLFNADPHTINDPIIDCDNINRLHLAQRMQFLSRKLWDRFYNEYFSTLQRRNKWQFQQKDLQVGDMVLLKVENVDTLQWPIGRVIETQPGTDGRTRVARLKTGTGEYERGITQLALLPMDHSLSTFAQAGEC